ncbi:MAG: ECF transporter S component, partial [bacterium]
MISDRTRKLVTGGLFIALAVGLGYALAQFPNIEMVTAVVFLSGYFMGWRMGAFVGAIAMFIYSTFNPYGIPFLPVLAMQVLSMATSGVAGGIFYRYLNEQKGWMQIFAFALLGFSLTVLYDFLTTLGEVVMIGFSVQDFVLIFQAFVARVLIGIGFYILHIFSNTVIFGALLPLILRRITVNRIQNQFVICFFCLGLTSNVFARQEEPPGQKSPPPDSLMKAMLADTLSTTSVLDSTAKAEKLKIRQRVPLENLPENSLSLHFTRIELAELLHEDTAELFQNLPGTRVVRSADLGLFAQMGVFGAPPRFTDVQFDDIPWPKGFYGQTNLTAIPEIFADDVLIAPHHTRINFSSSPPQDPKPWTYLEYVTGPFGVDVLRVRFKRSFSKHVQPYLALTFANSDGQLLQQDSAVRGGPYDAMKVYIRTDYLLSQNYRIRHRLINSNNDAVATTPFFFEELPEIIDNNARYEETRVMNSLELAKTAQIADSVTANLGEIDIWRFRLYNWVNREEYRDNAQARFIQHKNSIIGGSFNWRLIARKFSLHTYASAERHNISSPTIQINAINKFDLQTHSQLKIASQWLIDIELLTSYHDDFKTNFAGLAQIAFDIRDGWHVYGKMERKLSLPGAGEYANDLPDILASNNNLSVAKLDKIEGGVQVKKLKYKLIAAINRNAPQNTLALNISDSLFIFSSSSDVNSYFAYTLAGLWFPFSGLQIDFKFD